MKTISGKISVDWLEKDEYSLYFDASIMANYSYTPAKKYLRNGDPGYPAETNIEITNIDFNSFEIWDDGKQLSEDFVKKHPEYKKYCEQWIYDNEEEIQWDL